MFISKKILTIGQIPEQEFMEGGMVRVSYINQAIKSLGPDVLNLLPSEVANKKNLCRAFLRKPNILLNLINPFIKIYTVSNGVVLSPNILSLLHKRTSLLYFDHHDDSRIQLPALGIEVSNSELKKIGNNLIANLNAFKTIGLSSPGLKNFVPEVANNKFITIPNASDPNYFKPTPLPKKPIVGLIGGAGKNRGADLLIEACIKAKQTIKDLELKLAINDQSGRGNLKHIKEKYKKYSWITFEDIDYRNAPNFISSLKICVIPHRKSSYIDTVLPIKLFDYMASARPIISTKSRGVGKYLGKVSPLILCEDNVKSMATAIIKNIEDTNKLLRLSEEGRKLIEQKFNWQVTQSKLITALHKQLSI